MTLTLLSYCLCDNSIHISHVYFPIKVPLVTSVSKLLTDASFSNLALESLELS